MQKRQNKSKLAKIPQFLASIFILILFAFPMLATAKWVDGVVFGNDPRLTMQFESFNQRKCRPYT